MKARKAIAMGLIAAMSVGVLAGCGGDKKEEGKETADGKQKLTISTWDNDTSPQLSIQHMLENGILTEEITSVQEDVQKAGMKNTGMICGASWMN